MCDFIHNSLASNMHYRAVFSCVQENMWAPFSANVPSMSGTTKWIPPWGFSRENSIQTLIGRNSKKENTLLIDYFPLYTIYSYMVLDIW